MWRIGVAARALARRATAGTAFATLLVAATPSNLVVENVPDFPPQLVEKIHPYLDFRTAGLEDWNPDRPEALIVTRFAEAGQLHLVKMPGGARTQITFFPDRVSGGSFRPHDGNTVVGFAKRSNQDFQFVAMTEFWQEYLLH